MICLRTRIGRIFQDLVSEPAFTRAGKAAAPSSFPANNLLTNTIEGILAAEEELVVHDHRRRDEEVVRHGVDRHHLVFLTHFENDDVTLLAGQVEPAVRSQRGGLELVGIGQALLLVEGFFRFRRRSS